MTSQDPFSEGLVKAFIPNDIIYVTSTTINQPPMSMCNLMKIDVLHVDIPQHYNHEETESNSVCTRARAYVYACA